MLRALSKDQGRYLGLSRKLIFGCKERMSMITTPEYKYLGLLLVRSWDPVQGLGFKGIHRVRGPYIHPSFHLSIHPLRIIGAQPHIGWVDHMLD